MSAACRDFRAQLTAALERGPDALDGTALEALGPLGWHDHLLSCGACRALLEREEVLEELLHSLPDPDLPEHLARRVLAALSGAARSTGALDELLDLDPAPSVPPGLGARVLARVRPGVRQQDEALDRLLDLAAEVRVPEELGRRVLARVADAAHATRAAHAGVASTAARPWRLLVRSRAVRIAASLLAVFSLALLGEYALRDREPDLSVARNGGPSGTGGSEPVDEGLLAALDVLESWDVLEDALGDPDLHAFALFDTEDEVLLEFVREELAETEKEGGG